MRRGVIVAAGITALIVAGCGSSAVTTTTATKGTTARTSAESALAAETTVVTAPQTAPPTSAPGTMPAAELSGDLCADLHVMLRFNGVDHLPSGEKTPSSTRPPVHWTICSWFTREVINGTEVTAPDYPEPGTDLTLSVLDWAKPSDLITIDGAHTTIKSSVGDVFFAGGEVLLTVGLTQVDMDIPTDYLATIPQTTLAELVAKAYRLHSRGDV